VPQSAERFLVVVTEDLEPGPMAWLAERAEVVRCPFTDRDRLAGLLARADGLVVRSYTRVDDALLALAPRLRVVARAGVALENIDLPACRRLGVEVVHTPGANTRAVVEFVIAVVLDALRPLADVTGPVEPARWHALREECTARRQLSDLTLGLLGFGRVGSGLARVARALHMPVIYNDVRTIPPAERHGCEPVEPGSVFSDADIVSVHIDARPGNARFVGEPLLSRMRGDVVFLNTSRGFVVDVEALAGFLRAHVRARAVVDVHDPHEPIPAGYPLLGVPGARLTPHIAAGTRSAKTNMSWVVRDVWRVLMGERPESPAPSGDDWAIT
jgi:phosphoglycerate dehydrogenase-like enzyme